MTRAIEARYIEDLAAAFRKHGVQALFIGKAGAVIWRYPDTTQDADVFPKKSIENGRRIVRALRELGFEIDEIQEDEIVRGKALVQMRGVGPFDIDLVFAPDGIESFDEALKNSTIIDGLPVCSLEDIIKSKRAARRERDLEALPRLEKFAAWLRSRSKSRAT